MEVELSEFLAEELLQFCQSDDCGESDILLRASELFKELGAESKPEPSSCTEPSTSDGGVHTSKARTFTTPKTDDEVAKARSKGIPEKTQKDTTWCISLWEYWREHWREHRQQSTEVAIPPVADLDKSGLNY